jgi:DNA-binding LytR/AlgR family response regulator
MTKAKKLGIWMDHFSAHLMEFTTDPIETKTIQSVLRHHEKKHFLNRGEKMMHNKEQEEQAEYYKKLEGIIQNYEEVLLFGATEAKVELFNLLKADKHFGSIKIEMDTTDKMTENQQHAFVKEHFSKN